MAKLTDFQNELIDEIVALVFAVCPKQYLGAVHRVFLTSSRLLTFKSVSTCEDNCEPARNVETLCDLSTPHRRYRLTLDNLEELHVRDEGLANAVLEPPADGDVLPNLAVLRMTYEASLHSPNPFDPRRYEGLHLYPELDALELAINWSPSSSADEPISNDLTCLSRFPNLSSLELGKCTFLPAHLPSLASLDHLNRLVFGSGSRIAAADVVSLLRGPTKLSSLRTLRLDLVENPYYWRHSPSPRGYIGWTPSFTPEGVGELLDLAKKEGVKVTGLAAALVRRERQWERWQAEEEAEDAVAGGETQ
ncbi:hypothetical protein JCM8097_004228 [Rhodosporidiobolus ruineniae]